MAATKNPTPKKSSTASAEIASAPADGSTAQPTKAEFIRSLPPDLPAAEVVAKAKAIGIELSANHVHASRSSMKVRAKKSGKKATKVQKAKPASGGTKSATAKASSASAKPLSKTAFVLSLPRELPATEVIARAKAAGLDIARERVHVIRSTAKSSQAPAIKAGHPRVAAPKAKPVATSKLTHAKGKSKGSGHAPRHPAPVAPTPSMLHDLVFSLGFERLRALISDMEKRALSSSK